MTAKFLHNFPLCRTRALANRQLFEGQHGVTTEQAGAAGVAPGQVPVVVSQLLAQLQAQAHAQAALVDGMRAEAHTAPPTCRLAISMETEGGQAGVAVATLRQAAGAVSAGQAGAPPPESSTTDLTSMLQQRWEGSGVADTQLKIAGAGGTGQRLLACLRMSWACRGPYGLDYHSQGQ